MTKIRSFLQLCIFMIAAIFSFGAVQAHATDNSEQAALDFVKATAERGLTFLSKPESTQDFKKQEFKKLLNSSFDMDTIGRFALGRYWNTASAAQQNEYLSLFKRMIIGVYTERFSDYKGQKLDVKSARPVGNGDVLVTSYIVPVDGGDSIQVDWRVRNKGGTPKVVDVLVSGVSMSVTQRSDFSSVIQQGGGKVDVLIKYLKNKV